jgi:hypothetical protein
MVGFSAVFSEEIYIKYGNAGIRFNIFRKFNPKRFLS